MQDFYIQKPAIDVHTVEHSNKTEVSSLASPK